MSATQDLLPSNSPPIWLHHRLFNGLSPRLIVALHDHIETVDFAAGDVLIAPTHPVDFLLVVQSGALHSSDPDMTLSAGDTLGTFELLSATPLQTTLTATDHGCLYRLSRENYIRLALRFPTLTLSLAAYVLPGLQHAQVAEIFSGHRSMGVPIPAHALYNAQLRAVLVRVFGEIDPAAIAQLQNNVEWITLEAGQTLFTQGVPGTTMCIVVHGRLRIVYQDALGNDRQIGEATVGDTIGEFALLTDELRSATVTAVRESSVVQLSREVFYDLIERYPKAMISITQNMIRRQQRAQNIGTTKRKNSALTVALIPLHGSLSAEFIQGLLSGLSSVGSAILLDTERFDREFGIQGAADIDPDEPMGAVVAGWLSGLEREFDTLLYVGTPEWTPWTRRCIRQADRVYLLADATQPPDVSRLEQGIQAESPNLMPELVLLHPPETTFPSNTKRWLSPRKLKAWHHIRLADAMHYRRLARRMTGNALGMVLSGGAARGFVHMGVLRALEELNVELDLIGGTSMGALLGATYLLNRNYRAAVAVTGKFASSKALFDYTLPFLSVMTSRKVSSVYRHIFGDAQIEDFWLPFFAISSNMSRAVQVTHTLGSVRTAIRASTAIPGLFTPILIDNEVMVDGGLLDNFPISTARAMLGGGRLIGVLASPLKDSLPFFDITEDHASGWRLLFNRLNPLVKSRNVPSLPGLMMRTSELSNVLRTRKTLQSLKDDLILQIETSGFGLLDFDSHDALVELGYQQSRQKIAEWLEAQH
jgi:predicted acylesterase/phospholipase RssA/CRP-like cAMP-binding protein